MEWSTKKTPAEIEFAFYALLDAMGQATECAIANYETECTRNSASKSGVARLRRIAERQLAALSAAGFALEAAKWRRFPRIIEYIENGSYDLERYCLPKFKQAKVDTSTEAK